MLNRGGKIKLIHCPDHLPLPLASEGRSEIVATQDTTHRFVLRRDDNFYRYRKYMGGHYGALPLIG